MAQSSVNSGVKKSGVTNPVASSSAAVKAPGKIAAPTSAQVPAAKPAVVKPAAVKAPAKVAPKGPTVTVSIKAKDGSIKRVAMPKSKAVALAKKRAAARASALSPSEQSTASMIPGAYAGYVDPKSIDAAVNATIKAQNDPLEAAKAAATAQNASNAAAFAGLGLQTQASLDTLLANAGDRTQGFLQNAGKAIAATNASDQAASAGIQHALGSSNNEQVQAMTQAGMMPVYGNQNAAGVQSTWANSLASQAQQDFFQRAKGIAGMQTQDMTNKQAAQLGQVVTNLSVQQAANAAKKAQLVADTAAQQAQFGLSAQTAAQAFGQQGVVNAQKDYANTTDRMSVAERAAAAKAAADAKSAGVNSAAAAKLSKAVSGIKKDIDKMNQQVLGGTKNVTVPTLGPDGKQMTDKNGKPLFHTETHEISAAQVFGKGNGPWREAFTRLTDAGLTSDQAALQSTKWYKGSITRSDQANITAMLTNRGVSKSVIKQIVSMIPVDPTKPAKADPKAPKQVEPGRIIRGATVNTGGKAYTVTMRAKTIAGTTFKLKTPGGADIVVSVPTGVSPSRELALLLAGIKKVA